MVSNYVMIFYSAQLLQQFVQKDKYPCHAKQWPTPTSQEAVIQGLLSVELSGLSVIANAQKLSQLHIV
jgi:hypothetical protein